MRWPYASAIADLVQSLTEQTNPPPRQKLEEICVDFYDRELLSPLTESNHRQRFFTSLEETLSRGDRGFDPLVDRDVLHLEITAVRFELFGLALNARIGWNDEDLCLRELVTTERYLHERDEQRIWSAMGFYNQRLADAGFSFSHDYGQRGRRLGRRLGLSDRWQGSGVPDGCLVRFANRCDGIATWAKGTTMTALLRAISERLNYPLNGRSQLQFMNLLQLFYTETAQRLKQVRPS